MPDTSPAPTRTLHLRITKKPDTVTVYCRGDLTAEVADLLRNEVKPLIPTSKTITLDLSDIRLMDSSGLGTIVKLYVNFNRRVRELLGMTNLLRVFETCGDHTARMP
jgi:anti-anti-sigma factor